MLLINTIYIVLVTFISTSLAIPAHDYPLAMVQKRAVRTDSGNRVHVGNLAQVYVPLADEPTRMMGSKGVGLSVDGKPSSVPASPRKDNLLPKRFFEQNKLPKSAPQLDARALITSDMIGAL